MFKFLSFGFQSLPREMLPPRSPPGWSRSLDKLLLKEKEVLEILLIKEVRKCLDLGN